MSDTKHRVLELMAAARREAEALMPTKETAKSQLWRDQQRKREELTAKTQRLRELRLAKEAADREAAEIAPAKKTRVRRAKG